MNDKTKDILKISAEIFSEYGYKKTSMQDIGDRLSMTKSNFYIYFKNKEDLYKQSVSYELLKWRTSVEEQIADKRSSKEKLITMCKKSFEYIHDNEVLKKLVEKDPDIFVTNHDNDRFIDINMKAEQIVKDIINEGIKNGEFREVDVENISEYIFASYMMFLIKLYSRKDKYTTEKLVEDAVDLLVHGLLSK